LIKLRYPIYEKADIIIDSESLNHNETVEKVLLALRNYQEGTSHEH